MMLHSRSPSQTIRIGKQLGRFLRRGDVVALVGELGTGKTQLIKGLAQGIGFKKSAYISSPSFTLINEHPGKITLYHMDLYRMEEEEAKELGLEEYFQGDGVTAVEWADKIPSLLPGQLLWIHLYYTGKQTRSIELVPLGERYEALLKQFSSEFGVKH